MKLSTAIHTGYKIIVQKVRDQENKREKDLVKILESFVIPHERHES